MEKPKSIETVAATEKCHVRTVQKWAAQNGITKLGSGRNAPYIFFDKDIARFRERDKPGKPWPQKKKKG
jgi:hypothetical protein